MRKTPQIPTNVFFDEPPAPTSEPAVAAPETSSGQNVKTSKRLDVKKSKRQDASASNSQKRQVTIYLSEAALAALERARLDLILEHGMRVPKSAIAEQALLGAARDLPTLAAALRAAQD